MGPRPANRSEKESNVRRFIHWRDGIIAINDSQQTIRYNPSDHDYPKAGEVITLEGHGLLPDGEYLVTRVIEYVPPHFFNEGGRDLRLQFFDMIGEWSAMRIAETMKKRENTRI